MNSPLETLLLAQIQQAGIPEPCRETRFHPLRRWRLDMSWPALHLAVEIEGGTKSKSRHTNCIGYENDCRKYNEAVLHGWRLLRFTGDMIQQGEALAMLIRAMDDDFRSVG